MSLKRPTHYVNRTDSDNCGGMNRFLNKREDVEFQKELIKFERSAAGLCRNSFGLWL